MKLILACSEFFIPLLVFVFVGYGFLEKKEVYDCFIRGAGEGMKTAVRILPTLIGLMAATGVLRASGLLEFLAGAAAALVPKQIFPGSILPLAVVRMFSSSAAVGLLLDLFREYGADSQIGRMASLMMSSTETIFYLVGEDSHLYRW